MIKTQIWFHKIDNKIVNTMITNNCLWQHHSQEQTHIPLRNPYGLFLTCTGLYVYVIFPLHLHLLNVDVLELLASCCLWCKLVNLASMSTVGLHFALFCRWDCLQTEAFTFFPQSLFVLAVLDLGAWLKVPGSHMLTYVHCYKHYYKHEKRVMTMHWIKHINLSLLARVGAELLAPNTSVRNNNDNIKNNTKIENSDNILCFPSILGLFWLVGYTNRFPLSYPWLTRTWKYISIIDFGIHRSVGPVHRSCHQRLADHQWLIYWIHQKPSFFLYGSAVYRCNFFCNGDTCTLWPYKKNCPMSSYDNFRS